MKEIKDFKRKEIFKHYNSFNNPFVIITTKIDVTNVVKFCKKNKSFYGTMGYLVTMAANEIDNFKYRFENGKFYYCENIRSSYTEMLDDGNIGYFDLKPINNYEMYINEFINVRNIFYKEKKYVTENLQDEIWISCAPWFSFTSLIPPFNKEITIPQFIWDKYELVDDHYYLNLMIMAHHGFVDGSHIAKFIELLNKKIANF